MRRGSPKQELHGGHALHGHAYSAVHLDQTLRHCELTISPESRDVFPRKADIRTQQSTGHLECTNWQGSKPTKFHLGQQTHHPTTRCFSNFACKSGGFGTYRFFGTLFGETLKTPDGLDVSFGKITYMGLSVPPVLWYKWKPEELR